jgi:hypothetical protein
LSLLLVCASSLLAGCGAVFVGGCFNPFPNPIVDSVTPSTIHTQNLPVTMIITGTDFQTSSTVQWSSTSLPTTFVDSHHLSVIITSQILFSVTVTNGTGFISVFTPSQNGVTTINCPNGVFSSTFTIIVTSN